MAEPERKLVLGSGSPRRSDLLTKLGLEFEVEVVPIDEGAIARTERRPDAVVNEIAHAKFAAFPRARKATTLLTADTLVAAGDQIMGKPQSLAHLADMLRSMSGERIVVWTAVCVGSPGSEPRSDLVSTDVCLRDLTAEDIDQYCSTDVGMDKAGGLALQSAARSFIATVDGCWANVLGLPVCSVQALLSARPGEHRRCTPTVCGAVGAELGPASD